MYDCYNYFNYSTDALGASVVPTCFIIITISSFFLFFIMFYFFFILLPLLLFTILLFHLLFLLLRPLLLLLLFVFVIVDPHPFTFQISTFHTGSCLILTLEIQSYWKHVHDPYIVRYNSSTSPVLSFQ